MSLVSTQAKRAERIEISPFKEKLHLLGRSIKEFWKLYRRSKIGLIGLGMLLFFVAIAITAPLISPYDPWLRKTGEPFSGPSKEHPLGTDDMGRDILSQILWGTRISLLVGFIASLSATIIGVTVGMISGYFGGTIDNILMGLTDIILILPTIPLMIVIAAYLGQSIWNLALVIAIVSWPSTARIVRSQTLSLKEEAFVEAARSIGAGHIRIIVSHILPNVLPIILANTVLMIVGAIISEAGLSFLGLGDPTHQSWGMILYYAQVAGGFIRGAWWWIVTPGVCITLVGVSLTFIGYALDEIVNPRLRQR